MKGAVLSSPAAAKALAQAGFEERRAETGGRCGRKLADRDTLATTADIAALRADIDTLRADMRSDLCRALWIQTGAIVGPVVAVVKFL